MFINNVHDNLSVVTIRMCCYRCFVLYMSLCVRKPTICLCENKDADQLRGNREADQRLCFRYTDSTVPLLLKSKISSLLPSSVLVQPGLCRTWSETQIVGFLTHRLIYLLCCERNCCFWCCYSFNVVTNMSLCVRKPTIWRVRTRSDTNRAVQSQKMVRGWKFWI